MSNCVNKSSKEFKDCCKRLNVSPTTLEPIIHEFINIEGNENSFPSDVYIEERIHGKSMEVLEDSQVHLWENRYSQPKVFNTQEEALAYYNECNKYFPKESIGLKETLDSKYEVTVKRPVVVSQNYLETKFQEEETTKLLETFFFNKKEETAVKEEIKQEQSNQEIIKGELGVNKQQLISLLGSTMYQSGRQEVAIKEILQNAFDAVKIAKSKGQIEDGKIDIELDTTKRTIKIQDNGIGMTPQIVQKAFFTIGGSYKGDNVDNSLKSGGLGLAKMAFFFGSEYVEVTTIKDGIKTYVRATPEEIQNDNFNIVTSKTKESNGTTVEVKIPENYLDNNGELKSIYFSHMPSFLDKPMIGDVTVNTRTITGWSDNTTSSDKSQIPEGYFSIGKATSDFGNVEIYIKPKKTSSQYVRFAVLNSGLYQFNNSFKLNQEAQFEVIFNILPKVGVENALYPINNQREGFRSTVGAEINDLAFLLDKINNVLVRQSVASAFENAISINVKNVAKVTREKAGFEESLKSIRKELETSFKATTSTSNSKSSASPKSTQNVEISLSEVRENKEKEEQEKKRTSSLDTSDIKINEQQIKVNTINLDINKPVFHNNTTLVIEQDGQVFLEELGALLLELKDLYSQTYKDANIKTRHTSKQIVDFISQQYWGISFDKNYGGVNVNPSLFNFLGINPFYYVTQYEGVDTALMLTEYITHLIKHEFNHNYASGEGAEFTGRFPATDAEFAGIGPKFLKDWKNKLYTLIKTNLKTVVKYADEYQKSTNLGDGFKENNLTVSKESSNSSIINDGTDIQGNIGRENVQKNGGEFDAIIQEFIEEQVRKDKEWKEVQQRDAIEEEKQQIKQKAIADGTFMKAPNGKPTNLIEDQWLSVRTKAFKEWFGDWENDPENASKVVDENDEPLVVYHNSNNAFDTFDLNKTGENYPASKRFGKAAFFGPREVTNEYPFTITTAYFLNIRTPFKISEGTTKVVPAYEKARTKNPSIDGVFGLNSYIEGGIGEFVVFNPNQIKSAEYNEGYSLEDDNIYHENETVYYTATQDKRLEKLREQEDVSIVDLLNLIDSNSEYASIIELLNTKKQRGKTPLLKDIKVKIVNNLVTPESHDVKKLETSRGQFKRAYYDAASKTIIINSNGLFNGGRADSVILHEVLHAITVNRIKSNKEFRAEFDSIIEKYLEAFHHLKYRYGKENNSHYMEEFIADIWSNTNTIKQLKTVKSNKKLTLWDKIKNFFIKLFAGSEGTLLADASDALYRLLDELETDTSKDTFYEGEFVFEDGTTVKSPFIPNEQQVAALNAMSDFIDSNETHMTLSGYAGTGKTSLMEMLAEKVRKQHKHIVFSATTNKAAAVLKTKVGKIGFDAYTLNKVFGISVEVDSSKEYDAKSLVNVLRKSDLVFPGSIVVIDEASMINEHNYKVLNEIAAAEDIKIIYVGDAAQLAPVNEHKISKVFRDNEGKVVELNKVERTADNAILKEATALRSGEELSGESSFNDRGEGVAYISSNNRASVKEIIKEFIKGLKDNPDYFRILAYTNKAVNAYNRVVRGALGYTDAIPKLGEPMTGYANYGYNWRTGTYRLINSESYKVTEVQPSKTVNFTIGNNSYTLEVIPITLKDSLDKKESFDYVDIKNNPANLQVVKELAKEKSRLWDIARTASKEAKKIALQQINAIEAYLFVNDNVVEGERTLQAKVIDFGYALTIHKSQGSTFTHVLIDDVDVSTAKSQVDDPNTYALDLETGTIEKTTDIKSEGVNIQQQLRYVAVSRATNTVSIISDNVKNEDSPLNHISEDKQNEIFTPVQPSTKEVVRDNISSNSTSEFNLTSSEKLQEYQQSAEFYSGAADGADQAWAKYLREKGLKVKDFTVKDYDALPQSEKDRIEKDYQNIVQYLGRKAYPASDYRGKLVRRDMLQAEAADAVFAIGTFDSNNWISGGTAYAVTRAVGEKEVYFYDLNSLQWYIYEDQAGAFWPLNDIPTLTPHAAVVGTRDNKQVEGPGALRQEGHDAIKAVIEKTFNENTESSEENLTQDEIDAKANKETELDAIFQNTLQLTEQLKNIQDSGLISTSEFTQLAMDVAYYISDLITSWQENPEEFKQSAPTLAAKTDVRTLSRRELVEKIGVPKLLEVVKKALFGKRIPGVDARKTLLLFKNFDALIRFGSSAFNTVEDFQISYSEIGYTISDKVESTENENLSNEENAVIEENGDKQEHWQIDSKTVDTFLTMSQAVKKELARCYKLNSDGTISKNEFGINERISPRDATSCILRWTQGSLTLSDMITKLEGKQENNPWIKPIIEKLRDNSGKYSDFQSQFFGVFCKHFQEYYIVKEFKDGNNKVLRIMPVNRTPALNEIMTSIEVLFKLKAHPMFNNNGLIKEKLDLLKSYVDLLNEISTGNFEELSLNRISDGIAKIADLLGYKTTDEMVVLALTPESLYDIKKALGYIVSNLEKGLGDSNYNPFSFNKENKNGIRNNLKDFLQPLTEVLEDLAISSFFESGKMYQSYVIPSYMTKLMRKFQNSNEQEFKEFMQKEYGQYEWFRDQSRDIEDPNSWKNDWLRQLYSWSGDAKKRKERFGHKVQLSFVGHNYMRNMTGPEYVMAIMTEFFSGSKDSKETIVPTWYKIPMLSNKPSLEFIKFDRYRGIGYEETILEGLQQVFIQELGRIIEVKNRAYSDKDDRHIKNFDTNGQKFCFLDFLNDYLGSKAHTELGVFLNKKIDSSERLNIEEENKLFDLVRKEIDSFMTKKSNEIIKSYKNSGLFEAVKKIDGIGNTDAEIEYNLKNFIWNDTYASMMILQMTITDIAYYANAEDLQKRLAQIHAPGIRPNVEAMDYGEYDEVGRLIRKAERVCDGNLRNIFLKDFEGDAVIQNVIENLEVVFGRKENEAKTDAEKEYWKTTKEAIIDAFKDVNVTDAQAYNSITSYRKKAIMFGKWSSKNEEIYKKLKKGEWNIFDLETIFQPLKPFVYTNSTKESVGSKLKVGMQFKNAEYALLIADAILRNEDTGKPNLLKVLSEIMEESADRIDKRDKGIDTIMFASAVKAGLHGRLDIANFKDEKAAKDYLEFKIYGDGSDGYNETYVHTFPAEDYSIQQDYSPHFLEHSQADGSQKRMIIPSDLDPNAEYQVNDIEKPFTAEEFKKEYEETYAENIENSLNELEFELGLNLPTKKLRNIALSQVLQKEILSSPRYGIDLYIACSVDKDGNFNIPLGDPIQSKRIEQLINSIVKNRLNKQKIKGGPVIQVSNFGSTRLNIRFKNKEGGLLPTFKEWSEKNPDKSKDDYKKLQGGVAHYECYAPAYMQEMFEDFIDERGFIDWEAINKVEPEMLEMIGFRIPTEDLYSIAPMKIMGFLPKEAGEVIMMPYEVTVVWGSDYDVDKAYLQRKEFIIKMNNRRDIEDAFISKFGNKNKEDIKMFLDQAADPKTRMQAYGTYPKYAKFYRRVAFSVDKPTKGKAYRNNKIIDMSLAVLTHETSAHRMLNPGGFEPQKRMGYLVSAVILGKGTYEQLSKLSTNALKKLCMTDKNLSFIDINTQFYEQNNAAGSILGMFAVQKIAHATLENNGLYLDVNSSLQLAKNTPFIFCGKSFYGLVEFDPTLNNKGEYIGKVLGSLVASAADAVKDPVLNLMNINSTTANVLTTMIRFGIPFEQAALLTSQKIIGDCLKEFNVRNLDGYVNFATIIEEKLIALRDKTGITEGDDVSTEELTEKELIEGLVSDNPKIQYKALLAFSNFMTMANELKGPTFATRFNSISNAVGPQIVDNLIMANKMTQFSSNIRRKVGDNIVEIDINDIFNMHPILQQFARGLETANRLFGGHMPLLSQDFQAVLNSLPEGIGSKIYGDRKLLSKLADFYLSYLLVNSGCIDTTTSKGLDYYINKFPKEFFETKIKEKYPNNSFIQAIMVETTKTPDGGERFILKLETTGMETTDKEKLSAGWEDLAKEDFNLCMKLFKYCFYKGGIGFTPKTFMHLLPNSIKKEIPKYIESFKAQRVLHPEYVVDQFIRNNWQNNKLVPKIQDAEDFVEFDEVLSFGIVDNNYHSLFRGLNYCRIKINGKDVLFKINTFKNEADQWVVQLIKTTPLGNNGEYLEISKSNIEKTMDNTEIAIDDNTPDFPNAMPEVVENTKVSKTDKEKQYYLDLIARVITQDKVAEFKAKSSDEQQSFKPGMKKFFTKAFAKQGIEFNMENFDKLFEIFCS